MSRSRRTQRSSRQAATPGRIALGAVAAAVIIAIALCAQALGLNVLNVPEEQETPAANVTQPSAALTPTPRPTAVANLPDELIPIPGGYDGGWFQVYFTDPHAFTGTYRGSPLENALVQAIDSAAQSIDVAVFEMDSQPVTEALIRAHERGVAVRVVTDSEHGLETPDTTIDQLVEAGIPVVSDQNRRAFMHDKFFVIDGLYVWTGATNITQAGIYENNNNSILIRSRQLAQNYTDEFNELFAGQFGSTSPDTVANPVVNINGTDIETYFESEGDVPSRLVELLDQAHTLRFMAFSFTDGLAARVGNSEVSIMELIIQRAQAGQLDVQGIVEARSRSFVEPLFCANVDVRQDTNPSTFHHKVMIIDNEIVVMGSFNFSANASNDNDENLLIIHNPAIAQAYLEEFDRRWQQDSEPLPASAFDC